MEGEKYPFADRGMFEIIKTLGEGAFGSVYKVNFKDKTGIKQRALKVIKCPPEPHLEDACLKEIEMLKAVVDHHNITRIIDFTIMERFAKFDLTKSVCILMELCVGSLSDRLLEASKDYDHFKWMGQMSDALQFLHSKNIMHRDLKPDNILFRKHMRGMEVKVADFGLAKYCNPQDEFFKHGYLKSQVGTKAWTAPEVFQGKYSLKADVFSMGTIWHGILERQYLEDGKKRHFGAFVYIPGLSETSDRLPLGFAMYNLRKEVTVGMSSFGNRLSDSLKEITRKMIVYDYNLRLSAEEVHTIMTQIENDVLSLSRPQQLPYH